MTREDADNFKKLQREILLLAVDFVVENKQNGLMKYLHTTDFLSIEVENDGSIEVVYEEGYGPDKGSIRIPELYYTDKDRWRIKKAEEAAEYRRMVAQTAANLRSEQEKQERATLAKLKAKYEGS